LFYGGLELRAEPGKGDTLDDGQPNFAVAVIGVAPEVSARHPVGIYIKLEMRTVAGPFSAVQ
jgi:hypothetical protein